MTTKTRNRVRKPTTILLSQKVTILWREYQLRRLAALQQELHDLSENAEPALRGALAERLRQIREELA